MAPLAIVSAFFPIPGPYPIRYMQFLIKIKVRRNAATETASTLRIGLLRLTAAHRFTLLER